LQQPWSIDRAVAKSGIKKEKGIAKGAAFCRGAGCSRKKLFSPLLRAAAGGRGDFATALGSIERRIDSILNIFYAEIDRILWSEP
jgi:hypothetical protein